MDVTNIELELLVEDYGRMVSAICRRMISNREKAKEAAQEAWYAVIKSISSFRGDSKLSTWIYSVVSLTIKKFLRDERVYNSRILKTLYHGEDFDPPVEVDFDKSLWVKEMCDRCMTGVLHCLEPDIRLAFIFRDVTELSYPEIARIMKTEETTVRKQISRARKRIKNFLNGECGLTRPGAICKCRMNRHIHAMKLPEEFQKLRDLTDKVNLIKESREIFPQFNYWKQYL